MNRKQLSRLGLVFLSLAIVFYISNSMYGCNPSINSENLPVSEYQVSCLVNREINSSFTILFVILFIAFQILAWLEPKKK